jgi:DNA polymerase V
MSHCPFENLPRISAGFRSPSEDFKENRLDFNAYFRRNPPATMEWRVDGKCMEGAFIPHDSIVIIDCSLKPPNGSIVAATVNGENMIKQIVSTRDGVFLLPANDKFNFRSIKLTEDMDYKIWGTVTHVIVDLYYPKNHGHDSTY